MVDRSSWAFVPEPMIPTMGSLVGVPCVVSPLSPRCMSGGSVLNSLTTTSGFEVVTASATLADRLPRVHDRSRMLFPHHLIARRILVNAILIWLGWRFLAMAVGWELRTSLTLALFIVFLTTGLAVFDARRRSRRLLIENLGISDISVGILAALPPIVFESVWLLVNRT